MAAAIAVALELGSLLVGPVGESVSSADVDGRIFTPLIIKSSMPKGLKFALALSTSLVAVKVPAVELLEIDKV